MHNARRYRTVNGESAWTGLVNDVRHPSPTEGIYANFRRSKLCTVFTTNIEIHDHNGGGASRQAAVHQSKKLWILHTAAGAICSKLCVVSSALIKTGQQPIVFCPHGIKLSKRFHLLPTIFCILFLDQQETYISQTDRASAAHTTRRGHI